MHPTLQTILAGGPVVTDGAWGTQLQARGLPTGQIGDSWNVARPDDVLAVAQAYVEAGSQVILTNTFNANRAALAAYDLAGQIEAINAKGVEISSRAAGRKAHVFASIGPTGMAQALLEGSTKEEDVGEVFAQQSRLVAAAGADAIIFETMEYLPEACLAVKAAKCMGVPIVVSLSFEPGKGARKGFHTSWGVSPAQAAQELTGAGADVVGANCGLADLADYVEICRQLHEATPVPIWIKPNAGKPQLVEGKTVWPGSPKTVAAAVPDFIQAGAMFIGTCCGTSPEFIRAIRAAMP